MAWSQADIDTLKAAIAQGVRVVSYTDHSVTYNSLSEMREALALMEREVAVASGDPRPRVWLGAGSKGL